VLDGALRAAWRRAPCRDEIVMSRADFPTDACRGVCAETGARLVWIEPAHDGGVTPELLSGVLSERTAVSC
jgi:kynureninase